MRAMKNMRKVAAANAFEGTWQANGEGAENKEINGGQRFGTSKQGRPPVKSHAQDH